MAPGVHRPARWVWIVTAVTLAGLALAVLLDLRYHARLTIWTRGPADEGAPPGKYWAAAGALMWLVFLAALLAAVAGWGGWCVSAPRRGRSVRS